jgi:hypothetical protein
MKRKSHLLRQTVCLMLPLLLFARCAVAGGVDHSHYYAHDTVEDGNGVIAPWYQGQNGQFDLRVRIAAETLKRYPWTNTSKAVSAVPEYNFIGQWEIDDQGTITIPEINDWANGDLGQRAAYILSGLVDYYRYSGDAAAIAHLHLAAETLLDHCQTGQDHPWPKFLISVPTKGKPYGKCDPSGMIQLDIVAEVGLGLLRAYQVTGEPRWFETAQHWGDLLAEHRDRTPGLPPWNRYANPENSAFEDQMTGGVVFLLSFFDELIRLGYTGEGNALIEARDAGRAYLRDELLPNWTVNDVWGRNYWDWSDYVQAENVTEFAVRYLMENPEVFPNWRNDCRNILTLFLNHTSVDSGSGGDVFSGAWAYPESSGCCKRSLWYGPMELATVYAQYGFTANSEWAKEMARRQQILATYDVHETGVVEDNIEGGQVVAGDWFKIAHPMALKHVLGTMAWLPESEGAARENHIMRSSSVVTSVVYGAGRIAYSTFDAPPRTVDVLRLSFRPNAVRADEAVLPRFDLSANGYRIEDLEGGDCIVTIRHDGFRNMVVEGSDPQSVIDDPNLSYEGTWTTSSNEHDLTGGVHLSSSPGSAMTCSFVGNQVRLVGRVGPEGGLADVYLDDEKQLAGIDCWNPKSRRQQILYYRNGLSNEAHQLKIVVRGEGNPASSGKNVFIDGVQWSAASGSFHFGEGGGSTEPQRMIFGYPSREDYVDSEGKSWRPATEMVVRLGVLEDSVMSTWWTERRRLSIPGTHDPELYRHGVHAPEFWVNLTVGPGKYSARLMFVETRDSKPPMRTMNIQINGKEVARDFDATAAGGVNKASDLVFNDIEPEHGVIRIHFQNTSGGEAMIQAVELLPMGKASQ